MRNILLCILPTSIIYLVLLIAIIVLYIKHSKKNVIIATILLILFVIGISFIMPFYKDIFEKKTITFEGTYTNYSSHTGLLLCPELEFTNEDKEVFVYLSSFEYSKYDLSEGSTYKVTYYKNSHAVYSIELIE